MTSVGTKGKPTTLQRSTNPAGVIGPQANESDSDADVQTPQRGQER